MEMCNNELELHLSEEQLLLIGGINVLWARLEFALGLLIAGLDGKIEQELAHIVGWNMGTKTSHLRSRLSKLSSDDREKMCSMIHCLEKTTIDRNRLTHGLIVYESLDFEGPRLISWRKKSSNQELTMSWLDSLARDIKYLSGKFLGFCKKEGFLAKVQGAEVLK